VGEDWSAAEVAAIVADYRAMLRAELAGEGYNKASHRRSLRGLLNGRSDGSVEFKHANISAVLIEMGFPFISGYKQRVNVQELLRKEVETQVAADHALQALAQTFVTAPAEPKSVLRALDEILVPAPKAGSAADRTYSRPVPPRPPRLGIDYLAVEARNASLGLAGETFVLDFEHRSLWESGAKRLAERIEHVSVTRGDGLGYDILSFEPDGRERLIEVKTTGLGMRTPFFASRREVSVSEEMVETYHLYRVFRFRDDAKLFVLSGSLGSNCLLDPILFRATMI
jgi:hypothetical protein